MKKIVKLKICNWSLLPLSIAIMISGIQLEATQSSDTTSVWIHIAVGILFSAMVLYHIFLHFSNSDWFSKFNRQKSRLTRILWPVSLITFISGPLRRTICGRNTSRGGTCCSRLPGLLPRTSLMPISARASSSSGARRPRHCRAPQHADENAVFHPLPLFIL